MRALAAVMLGGLASVTFCSAATADPATCASVGQSMISLQSGVNDAVVAAAKATLAASSLPGTRRANNPNPAIIEEQSANVETAVSSVLSGLGPLVEADFGVPTVQQATSAVTSEAQAESQEALSFGRLSIRFLRLLTERDVVARHIALANALRAFGAALQSSTSFSNTQGTVGGQPFSATTVTRTTPANPQPTPIQIPPDSTVEQTAEALDQEQTRLLFLPYTFNPLVARWTAACRAAGQLPPEAAATPTATP